MPPLSPFWLERSAAVTDLPECGPTARAAPPGICCRSGRQCFTATAGPALWSAARPVFGEVELTGCLIGDIGDGPLGHVRGRVLRIRVVTETAEATGPDRSGWHRVPSAQRLHDVEIAPRWFAHGRSQPPVAPRVYESGVLADLDLDDVPPLPLRPSIVAGSLAAHGSDLWVADGNLPVLMRLRDRAGVAVFTWAGRIGSGYDLRADADGCWLTGADGIFRCDQEGSVVRVRQGAVHAGVDGTLAAQVIPESGNSRPPSRLCLLEPSGIITDVPIPELSIRPSPPSAAVSCW